MATNRSIKLKQIINDEGEFSLDIFKNYDLPDDSKLSLNCHGEADDSIIINSPNGGILNKSLIHSINSRLHTRPP